MAMKALALIGLVAFAACGAPPRLGVTASDARWFRQGVALQRAVDIFQNPRACAIVLLRTRCERDVAVVLAHVGERDIARWRHWLRFASTGDMSDYPAALGDLNTAGIRPLAAWKSMPRETWFEAAGIDYVLATNETSDVLHVFDEDELIGDLNEHADDAGTRGLLGRTGSQGDVVAALRDVFPDMADPQVATASDAVGEYRRGAYVATFNALGEVPVVLLEPQSRGFVIALVDADLALGAATADEASLKKAIETRTSARDMLAWFLAVSELNTAASDRLSSAARARVLVGLYAAQGAQNAGVWREQPFDAKVRDHLTGRAAAALPSAADIARRAYLAAKPDDWKAKNRALSALVMALLK
jgi:hypothetical protein